MQTFDLTSWQRFRPVIDQLLKRQEELDAQLAKDVREQLTSAGFGEIRPPRSTLLFRGQPDARWSLRTTLERQTDQPTTLVSDYLRTILTLKPEIETYIERAWDLPDDIDERFQRELRNNLGLDPAIAPYLAYLRHHGFPSPLLDWTTSPYIAAYFAFAEEIKDVEHVAIYVYLDGGKLEGLKEADWGADSRILFVRSAIRAHRRHFSQRSKYTLCVGPRTDGQLEFSAHDEVMRRTDGDKASINGFKIKIPASDRRMALKELELYDITSYSLFGSEDSLMQSLGMREYLFRR